MKKGNYYIYTRQDGKDKAIQVSGYIIPDPESGLTFGARFCAGSGWEVSELSTGALISAYTRKPKTSKDIQQFINDMRPAVLSAISTPHIKKMVALFNELVKTAKAQENAESILADFEKSGGNIYEYTAVSGKKCYRVVGDLPFYDLLCSRHFLLCKWVDDFHYIAQGNGFSLEYIEHDIILAIEK